MIKGLAITPPLIGRIAIGKLVEKDGRYLPEKDDAFTLTTQVQSKNGWILHPLHQALAGQATNGKIRSIPVTLLFDSPELNLRAAYSVFDRSTGRPLSVGNGENAKRFTPEGVEGVPCPGPDLCPFAQTYPCKPFGRLNVQVDGQDDALASFIFRTTGFNSIRTLAARLNYFQAVSGGLLASLPLSLKLRAKSTTQSYRAPVYYVDLTLREGLTLEQALSEAKESRQAEQASGFNRQALEQAAAQGLANGLFEESGEEMPQLLEEFYPEAGSQSREEEAEPGRSLSDKLRTRTERQDTVTADG